MSARRSSISFGVSAVDFERYDAQHVGKRKDAVGGLEAILAESLSHFVHGCMHWQTFADALFAFRPGEN
jgi:hypothetical protein